MEWIRECLTNVVAIFPMANPFSTVPLLLSLSARMSIEERVKLGDRACKNAVIFMLITLFMGTLLLHFFNISVPSLRIAGGLVVAFLGFGMLFHKEVLDSVDHDSASQSTVDYSIIPLAFPSLSGAGTLATIMTISASITAKETLSAQLSGYAACAVAGKTGTAQHNELHADHVLFVGYAPAESPQISIAVRITYGYNSGYSAEIGRDIARVYFNQDAAQEVVTGSAADLGTGIAGD